MIKKVIGLPNIWLDADRGSAVAPPLPVNRSVTYLQQMKGFKAKKLL